MIEVPASQKLNIEPITLTDNIPGYWEIPELMDLFESMKNLPYEQGYIIFEDIDGNLVITAPILGDDGEVDFEEICNQLESFHVIAVIHNHPITERERADFHSGQDFANFLFSKKDISIVVSPNGIAVLKKTLKGKSNASYTPFETKVSIMSNIISTTVNGDHETSNEKRRDFIIALAKTYDMELYWLDWDGNSEKLV